MKVKTVAIGEYQISPSISFCLYQFISPYVTPPLQKEECVGYYCLEDLFSLFDLQFIQQDLLQLFKSNPEYFCRDTIKNQHFIQTHILSTIAFKHQLYLLADLCRLNENQLISGAAVQLLKSKTILRLHSQPTVQYVQLQSLTSLSGDEWFFTTSPRVKRLSVDKDTFSSSSPHIMSSPILPALTPQSEDMKLPKPSSLLLKRLAPKHGHKKNLTILTPSYNTKDTLATIHSAPLKRTTIPPRTKTSKVTKKSTLSPPQLRAPATAIASRFPSPPIVPSQQPTWSRRPKPTAVKTATIPYFPHHTTASTTTLTQKQKFLQPFEYLYDHIEQTRTLKMTLDDQIRRSSGLIQQLQKINIQSIVQKETEVYMQKEFQDRIQECTRRIEKLEYSAIPISPAISPPPPTCSMDTVLSQLLKRIDQLESKLSL